MAVKGTVTRFLVFAPPSNAMHRALTPIVSHDGVTSPTSTTVSAAGATPFAPPLLDMARALFATYVAFAGSVSL